MKKLYLTLWYISWVLFIGIAACQRANIDKTNFKYQDLFRLSSETENFITSNNEYKTLKNNLSDFDSYMKYYAAHGKVYQKDYSSMVDIEEIRIASLEYIISNDDFLSHLNAKQRGELLRVALEKQQNKFDMAYSDPMMARQTGLHLIIQLLSIEKREATLQSISDYCDKHSFPHGVYNDQGFHGFLVKLISSQ